MLKSTLKWVFGIAMVLAGANHFWHPDFYLAIMPPYIPFHAACVAISGVAEIALGVMLLIPRTTALAAWGLIALLIAIYPANIHMAMHPELFPQFHRTGLLIRLPIQFVLIAWAWWYTRPDREGLAADKHG